MEILIIQRWHEPPVDGLRVRNNNPWIVYESKVDLANGEQEISETSFELYGDMRLGVTAYPSKRKGALRFYVTGKPMGVRSLQPPRVFTLACGDIIERKIGPFEVLRVSRERFENHRNGHPYIVYERGERRRVFNPRWMQGHGSR